MEERVLTFQGVGHRYGRRWTVRRVTFEQRRGDALVVTGRNGSGKSTLLRLAVGLMEPTEGRVRRRGAVGFAGLDLNPYAELSGPEHLRLAASLRGQPTRLEVLNEVGLDAEDPRPAGAYSTGMRARLKLAIALQDRPDLLVLDEPGASLDAGGLAILEAVVAEQRERGAVLIATNDPTERRFATHELELGA